MQLVVSLGALLADVPHSLPVHISGSSTDPQLSERLGLRPTGYEGPTGIVGVLQAACVDARHPRREPVGERPPLRRRGPQPEGRARAAAPARGPRRRRRRRLRARDRGRRLRAPGRARGAERPRGAGLRRAPRAARGGGARARRRTSPRATASPASSSASCASAGRAPTNRRDGSAHAPTRGTAHAPSRAGACTHPPTFRLPDRRSGTRTSRRPRARAWARSPARGCPRRPPRRRPRSGARAVVGPEPHARVVEHVVVGALGRLELPRLARGDRVERELDVVAQLLGALGDARLVVDQLVAAAGELVDAVDAPADLVAAEREGERALEPARLAAVLAEPLVVAQQRDARLLVQLALLVGVGEAAAPPARLEQRQDAPRCRRGPSRGSARAPGGRGSRSAG